MRLGFVSAAVWVSTKGAQGSPQERTSKVQILPHQPVLPVSGRRAAERWRPLRQPASWLRAAQGRRQRPPRRRRHRRSPRTSNRLLTPAPTAKPTPSPTAAIVVVTPVPGAPDSKVVDQLSSLDAKWSKTVLTAPAGKLWHVAVNATDPLGMHNFTIIWPRRRAASAGLISNAAQRVASQAARHQPTRGGRPLAASSRPRTDGDPAPRRPGPRPQLAGRWDRPRTGRRAPPGAPCPLA